MSRDWASLAPHSSKFHASPLNPAYRKRSLSFFFLPVASQRVFETQIKATAYMAGKKTTVLCPCPPAHVFVGAMLCDGQDLGIHPAWGHNLPKSHSAARSRGKNLGFGCFEEHYQTNTICQLHHCWGFIPRTCEMCICDDRFRWIWCI